MRISVVIPTFNRAERVCKAIDSVRSQTLKASDIIVVDDGSTDDTDRIVRQRYPCVKVIRQTNAGVSSARNAGIRAATGDWIALLDSDDEWLPHKLEHQSHHIRDQPHYRLYHCDELWIRNGVRVNPKLKHRKYGGWIYPQCLPLCAISPSAVLLRRDVFDTVGYFDESLPACEDYDYWLRFCAHEPVGYLEEALLRKYGGHDDQLSRRYWGMDRFRMQALAKAIESGKLDAQALRQTQHQLTEKLRIFLLGAHKHGNLQAAKDLQRRYQTLIGKE